jgi:two-component system chemotaxis sensor kinase CheA
MSDSWNAFIEYVDAQINRLACETVLESSIGAVQHLQIGLLELSGQLGATGWPDIEAVATRAERLAAKLAGPADMPGAIASLQEAWSVYQQSMLTQAATLAVSAAAEAQAARASGAKATADAEADAFAAAERQARNDEDLEVLRSDPDLAQMFIGEALDHLSTIEASVLQLEVTPDDQKLLNDVFRPFHTVKGNSGALGVKSVQEFAHKVENLLDLARSGKLAVGPDEIDVILRAVDLLTDMISGLNPRLAGHPWDERLEERAALMYQVDRLTGEGDAAPAADAVAAPQGALDVEHADHPVARPVAKAVVAAAAAANAGVPPEGDRRQQQARRQDDVVSAAVKVDTRKLDSLVDMVGELVIVQSLISEDPAFAGADDRLTRNLAQLKRLSSDLQRNAMSMRMVPVRQTFQKMARLVRDLSKKSGKPVDLVLAGEDTELDRKVVEDINDPLMHMIRNSVDHGIESPEKRRAAGKSAAGRLSLSAYHQGAAIVIAIQDDGGGLNQERILAKAIENGLIPVGAQLTTSEIHQLIFRPGFSTAEKITEVSGRGVGMDVVRRNIETLRGRIEIQSEPGQGTTFLIKLPLTLAIVEGLLLRVGRERFVMPTFAIRESLRPAPNRVHSIKGKPRMVQVRDTLLPLMYLSEVFNIPDAEADPCNATVVVIEDDGRHVALMVDQLLGKQEVVVKTLGPAFSEVRGVSGGAILGDGRVGLILDAGGVVALMDDTTSAHAAA